MLKLSKITFIGLSPFILIGYSNVFAGGFQLFEESVSALGNAFAGTAATAEDASTSFYNPAAMTLLKGPEVVAAGTAIQVNVDSFASSSTANSLVGLPFALPSVPVQGNSKENAGTRNIIPALHIVMPQQHCFAFGLSITSPYGLNTNYSGNSKIKYISTRSKLQVVDVGPTVAVRVVPQLSLGAGIDLQYARAKVTQKIPIGESLPPFPYGGPYPDGELINNASNKQGFGWNAGLLYEFSGATRVGLDYRSRVNHTLEGNADIVFITPIVPSLRGDVFGKITLPDTANLSLYHDFNYQWSIMGSVNYTHWSLIDTINLHYAGPVALDLTQAELPLKFEDTYRVALGVDYAPSCRWKLRSGIAYDQSPVRGSQQRTFRIPDSDRYWIGLGAQYKVATCIYVDAGYSHLFVNHSSANQTQVIGLTPGGELIANAIGNFRSRVNEIGLQLTWLV